MFPETSSIGLRCLPVLKPAPPGSLKLQGKQIDPSPEKLGIYFSMLSVQCPRSGSLPRTICLIAAILQEYKFPSPPEPSNQGCPLSSSCAKGTRHVETPFWVILMLWAWQRNTTKMMPASCSKAEGECKDGTHWKKKWKERLCLLVKQNRERECEDGGHWFLYLENVPVGS